MYSRRRLKKDDLVRIEELHDSELSAKTLLRQYKRIDPFFASCYGMNLYRGCSHGCIYCDGRNEKYNVPGDFDTEIGVKTNAPALLDSEISRKKKNSSLKQSYIMLGGGVGDFYQHLEKKYRLTRELLKVLLSHNLPVHLLTKSASVLDDIELIQDIAASSHALVNFSLSSSHGPISRFLEPGASSPTERLRALETLRKAGVHGGIFMMPVVPKITDSTQLMKQTLTDCKNAGAEFVTFAPMTLKKGRQMDYFIRKVAERDTHIAETYHKIYRDSQWGNPDTCYSTGLIQAYDLCASEIKLPRFIPYSLFHQVLSKNDAIAVMLDQMSVIRQSRGEKSYLYKAAQRLQKLSTQLTEETDVCSLPGISREAGQIIKKILNNDLSEYMNLLLS